MWENAEKFGALLLFAEHRYFGLSKPFESQYMDHLQYLTHEQALADYAVLLRSFQAKRSIDVPVIAFGGSYGGMLAAWFRMKYPGTIQGAIAASAPILGFPLGYPDRFQGSQYWQVVTHDASEAAGAAANCTANVRAFWPAFFAMAETNDGRRRLSQLFRLCKPLQSTKDAQELALSLMMSWDSMSMGNFPYPSSYLTEGKVELPAFPVRVACAYLSGPSYENETVLQLMQAMKAATDVYSNATQDVTCVLLPQDYDGIWDYVFCSQMLPQESYFDTDGVHDMFWPRHVSFETIQASCATKWKVNPDPQWIRTMYGSANRMLSSTSNIVFSNGGYDPWSAAGVLSLPPNAHPNITIVLIPEGAHHLDLMFSDTRDPPSVIAARRVEIAQIHAWIASNTMTRSTE
jgi:lysosomal Pro-X carboxypeptidase